MGFGVICAGCSSHNAAAPAAGSGAGSAVSPVGPIAEDYRADIDNLCNVEKRSGADQLEPAARNPTIAMWLGPNIKTTAAHQFLVQIQPLQGADKANALEAEAKRVGISECPLASEWRTPGAVNPP